MGTGDVTRVTSIGLGGVGGVEWRGLGLVGIVHKLGDGGVLLVESIAMQCIHDGSLNMTHTPAKCGGDGGVHLVETAGAGGVDLVQKNGAGGVSGVAQTGSGGVNGVASEYDLPNFSIMDWHGGLNRCRRKRRTASSRSF